MDIELVETLKLIIDRYDGHTQGTEELKTLRDGEQVAVLRFIDQPIRLHLEEQTNNNH